ncbi:UNKNOWN [Stylonychia lemnae]|uniref:Uncharacterized protein n=1 Tax=Stylonychia lemnae TaxID=5949 RepID=A0A078ADW3_STYLE|nr:UNKNOWN [Stylonychia lemnae]|eukprot:CDW79727.1 UNKNOWN [Stylonychia lemnae]
MSAVDKIQKNIQYMQEHTDKFNYPSTQNFLENIHSRKAQLFPNSVKQMSPLVFNQNSEQSRDMFPSLERKVYDYNSNQNEGTPRSNNKSVNLNNNPYNSRLKEQLKKNQNMINAQQSYNFQHNYSSRLKESSRRKLNKIKQLKNKELLLSIDEETQSKRFAFSELGNNQPPQQQQYINEQSSQIQGIIQRVDTSNTQRQKNRVNLNVKRGLFTNELDVQQMFGFSDRKASRIIGKSIRVLDQPPLPIATKDIELTSRLLQNKVTGVSFYMKDLNELKKLELKRRPRKAKTSDQNKTTIQSIQKTPLSYQRPQQSPRINEVDQNGQEVQLSMNDQIQLNKINKPIGQRNNNIAQTDSDELKSKQKYKLQEVFLDT